MRPPSSSAICRRSRRAGSGRARRRPRAVERAHQFLGVLARLDVEVGLRLVEQQHVRVAQQARGKSHELPLAAGEDARRLRQVVVVEPDFCEQRTGTAPKPGPPAAVQRSISSSCRRSSRDMRSRSSRPSRAAPRPASARPRAVQVGARGVQRRQRVALVALELLRQEASTGRVAASGRPGRGSSPAMIRTASTFRRRSGRSHRGGRQARRRDRARRGSGASRSSSRDREPGARHRPGLEAERRIRRGACTRRSTGNHRPRSSNSAFIRPGRSGSSSVSWNGRHGTSKAWISAFSSLIGASLVGPAVVPRQDVAGVDREDRAPAHVRRARAGSRRLDATGRPWAMSLIPPCTISISAPSTASSKRAAISSVRSPQMP